MSPRWRQALRKRRRTWLPAAIVVLIVLSLLAWIADSMVVFAAMPAGLAFVVTLAYEAIRPVWHQPETDRLYAAAVWFLTFAPTMVVAMLVVYLSMHGDSGNLLAFGDIQDMRPWVAALVLTPPFLSIGAVAMAVSLHRGRPAEWLYTAAPGLFLISIIPGTAIAEAISPDFFTVYHVGYVAYLPAIASVLLAAAAIHRILAPVPGFEQQRSEPTELPDFAM